MQKRALQLLKKLTEAHGGPSGEHSVRKIFCDELSGNLKTDHHGSIIHTGKGESSTPKIMVEAHMDEVGFMVQSITPDGYLRFVELGAWWGHTLLAQRVRILTDKDEEVLGIITSRPPHFLTADERKTVLKIEDMYIDVGATNADEVTSVFGIGKGDIVVPESNFTRLKNQKLLVGKAFDNRAGVALLIQVTQLIEKEQHPNAVFSVGTVQEEVGVRGVITAVNTINPDVAIVLEGTPADDTPDSNSQECQSVLGKGPQIRLMDSSAILHRSFSLFARRVAEECKIPYQVAVRRSGGTDAKMIQIHGSGIPTMVIGVPARYIHTHNSMIHMDDYLNALQLVFEIIKRFDMEHFASIINLERA